MLKLTTTGKILEVKPKSVKIKIANDDTFVIGFDIPESDYQMYLDRLGQKVTVSMDETVDKVKNKLFLNWTISMGVAEDVSHE